jgi:phytoene desaturase
MAEKHVGIIGAGPGGLTAAMLLGARGYKVTLFEKKGQIGGRNAQISLGEYRFDTGPTFLMMDFVLREMFSDTGRDIADYCELVKLDPMYRLSFDKKTVEIYSDRRKMQEQIERHFPGQNNGLQRFYTNEALRYKKMYPCLQKPYSTALSLLSPPLLKAVPYLSLGQSLFGNLGRYFNDDQLRISFTFQAKYLGMSPWSCPAAFTIIPYIEHQFGIYHVTGGLSVISDAMAKVAGETGVDIRLNQPVEQIKTHNRRVKGVRLGSGEFVELDAVVLNADFGAAVSSLFEPGVIRKWTHKKLAKKSWSCSTFMLYLGLDTCYDEPHHNIIFANDYKNNIMDITDRLRLSDDMSVYVRNASVTDPTLAPKGHSALYVLVPVPNNFSDIHWDDQQTAALREKVLTLIEQRTSMSDLRRHITAEHIITPPMWEQNYDTYRGTTFNLGHTIPQMLYFRPRNRFEEVQGCYLTGGGTHPGSGLPTIYESARISTQMIVNDLR